MAPPTAVVEGLEGVAAQAAAGTGGVSEGAAVCLPAWHFLGRGLESWNCR